MPVNAAIVSRKEGIKRQLCTAVMRKLVDDAVG